MDDVDRLLGLLAIDPSRIGLDRAGLATVQRAVLNTLPLHDVDVIGDTALPPGLDGALRAAANGRGNWRFGSNMALGVLLRSLGFDVAFSGAAVLLDGPNRAIDHVVLEVSAPGLEPHLVDVGLACSPIGPVRLNTHDEQRVGPDLVQLLASPQGTTMAVIDGGIPAAVLRFRRVAHDVDDFTATILHEQQAHRASTDQPTITRLLDHRTGDRVTISGDTVDVAGAVSTLRTGVAASRELARWFPTWESPEPTE